MSSPTPVKGSCLCAKIQFQYTGPPHERALCHCIDCQKWTGSSFSPCVTLPIANLKLISGNPKRFDVTGGSGKINKYFFCGDCGSSLWNEPEATPQWVCVRMGVLDQVRHDRVNDRVNDTDGGRSKGEGDEEGKIGVEFYVKDRVAFLLPIEGARQVEKM